jgi:SPP1 gp7 family putative phage head morphogenesis protein
MVAGLTKADVLADLKIAVDKAIAEGTTLADFRKEFDKAIQDKWEPDQSRGWRARVIFETNVRTSYAAGRYQQLQEMKDTHPYWQYHHGDSRKPRQEHLANDGKVLPADDPWWDKNAPPNGYNCSCYISALTEGQVERLQQRKKNTNIWIDTDKDVSLDPNWLHAPGMHTTHNPNTPPHGWPSPKESEYEWQPLPGFADQGNPSPLPAKHNYLGEKLDYDESIHTLPQDERREKVIELVKKEILNGADRKVFDLECGDLKEKLVISAVGYGGHIEEQANRLGCLGYIPDVMNPQEVWANFAIKLKKPTAANPNPIPAKRRPLVLRFTAITRINHPKYNGLALIYQNNGNGEFEAYTFYPLEKERNIRATLKGHRIAKAD